MSAKKLRMGFIGAGGIAQAHMTNLKRFEDVELVAAADVSEASLQRSRNEHGIRNVYRDWKEMLKKEDLQAVSVCTPNGLHMQPTLDAFRAGCHVLVEKPLAMNAKEGQKMLDAAERAGKKLVIAFQWRFHPKTQFIKSMADQGAFGNILFMRCQAIRRRGIPNWGVFGRKELQGGGPMIDIGVHIMEMAHYVMGSPEPVAATGNIFRYIGDKPSDVACMWPKWDHKTYTVEDLAIGHIRFANGAIMQVEASFAAHAKDAWNFQMMGEKGGVEFDPLTIRTDENGYMIDKTPAFVGDEDCFTRKMRAFVDTALHGTPSESSGEAGLMIQKMIDGIYASAAKGKEVSII
jgi:predicted dehydrogenase